MDIVNMNASGTVVSSASGRGNKKLRGQHLYVLQDSTGRIKIGRSGDPERRCRDLQNSSGRKITLVLVLEMRGDDEQRVLASSAEHRVYGEWFINSEGSRRDISAAIGVAIEWPLPPQRYIAAWREEIQNRDARAAVDAAVARIASGQVRKRDRSKIVAYLESRTPR